MKDRQSKGRKKKHKRTNNDLPNTTLKLRTEQKERHKYRV